MALAEREGNRITVKTEYRDKDLIRAIPGSRYDVNDHRWYVPLSWAACLTLRGLFRDRLEIGPALAEWATKHRREFVEPAMAMRESTATDDTIGLQNAEFYPYQQADVTFLRHSRRALLTNEMGTGKTPVTIRTLAAHLGQDENPFPALVTCPNNMKGTWQREFSRWWPGVEVVVLDGGRVQRLKQIKQISDGKAHVLVANWEALRGHSKLAPYGSTRLKHCVECDPSLRGDPDVEKKHKRQNCERCPRELNEIAWTTMIADECFIAGTTISTPHGDRAIEELKVGDIIWGYDHEQERVIESRVAATMTRKAASIVDEWNATPNHPVWTTEGYRRLGDLTGNDDVLTLQDVRYTVQDVVEDRSCCDAQNEVLQQQVCVQEVPRVRIVNVQSLPQTADHQGTKVLRERVRQAREEAIPDTGASVQEMQSAILWSTVCVLLLDQLQQFGTTETTRASALRASLQAVWHYVFCRYPQKLSTTPVLQQSLLEQVSLEYPGIAGTSSTDDDATCSTTCFQRVASYADARSGQPGTRDVDGATAGEREARLARDGVWTEQSTSETVATRDAVSSRGSRGNTRVCCGPRSNRETVPCIHRSSVSGSEASGGDRRRGTPLPATQDLRCASNGAPRSARVVHHQVLELRNRQRYLDVCEEGALPSGGEVNVYSLTTETGNYFAHGILVKNCHKSKEPKAKQTRALWAIATDDTKFRYALTGTPIADAPQDMWPALHFIDPDSWPSRSKYVDRWCLQTYNPFGGMHIIGLKPETKDEFFAITDPHVRRIPKSLVLSQLPDKVYTTRYVDMQPKQRKAYEAMRDEMVAKIETDEGPQRLVATNPLVQLTRLSQFASSYAELVEVEYKDPDAGETKTRIDVALSEPSNKVDALLDVLEELGTKPAVVFAQSRQLVELASTRLEKQKISHALIVGGQTAGERQGSIERFQRGDVRCVLATVGAGGVGITLTRADVAIFLQRSWSMIDNVQAEDRIHRIGSEIHESITIVDIVSTGTVEEGQRLALEAKGDRLQEIVRDAELIRKLLGEDTT